MPTLDPRVDAYIERAAPFAKPILKHLRRVVHAACPPVIETIKWGVPHFVYHGTLCSMAAFKAHCVFGFWKGALITGNDGRSLEAMGSFGRLTSIRDLPSRAVLARYVKKAAALNASGAKIPRPIKHTPAAKRRLPADLAAELRTNAKARATWQNFTPSARAEYIEWLTDAKRPATRELRLATTLTWLAQGKQRHWKYQKRQ